MNKHFCFWEALGLFFLLGQIFFSAFNNGSHLFLGTLILERISLRPEGLRRRKQTPNCAKCGTLVTGRREPPALHILQPVQQYRMEYYWRWLPFLACVYSCIVLLFHDWFLQLRVL